MYSSSVCQRVKSRMWVLSACVSLYVISSFSETKGLAPLLLVLGNKLTDHLKFHPYHIHKQFHLNACPKSIHRILKARFGFNT